LLVPLPPRTPGDEGRDAAIYKLRSLLPKKKTSEGRV
jgi:hypothetical protein